MRSTTLHERREELISGGGKVGEGDVRVVRDRQKDFRHLLSLRPGFSETHYVLEARMEPEPGWIRATFCMMGMMGAGDLERFSVG